MATPPRFEDITETVGVPLSPEGASMLSTRYEWAQSLAAGCRVLELGCGGGQGLGLLAASAARVIGGDYSAPLLSIARRTYGTRIPLTRLSAEQLPFADKSFDLVLLFEASYYIPDLDAAFAEMARVLAPGGSILLANANPERPDFIRSPHSHKYYSADQFRATLGPLGMQVVVEGAFPVQPAGDGVASRLKGSIMSAARQVLERLHLVPGTLKGRARLKRLLFRGMRQTPAELPPHFAELGTRTPLAAGPAPGWKVIYVQGRK